MRKMVLTIVGMMVVAAAVYAGATNWIPRTMGSAVQLADGAGIPLELNHQGVVKVDGQRFTGTGQFRFAIIDPQDGSKNRWTNDGSAINGTGSPSDAVALQVTDGFYQVRLGDTTLANMEAIDATLFEDESLELRVWFNDGSKGTQLLVPDQRLSSSPYAFMSAKAAGVKITDAAAAGKVLTSDAAGNGAWQTGGKVIQTQLATSGAELGFTSKNSWEYVMEASITPQRSDSVIVCVAALNGVDNGGAGRVEGRLIHEAVSGGIGDFPGLNANTISKCSIANDSFTTQGMSSMSIIGSYAPGSTATQYVKLVGQHHDTAVNWWINHHWTSLSSILLMEVVP